MPSIAPILSLRDFGVAFGDRVVLNAVNMELAAPGMIVVMGPVGTGKSTLLRTIAGINHAVPSFRSWGEARYRNAPLGADGGVALVAQNARLLMASVMENIVNDLPLRNQLTLAAKREAAVRLLAEAGLNDLQDNMDRPVVELPLAVQRHLAVARTAAAEPGLLCVDEPTANLDWADSLPLLRFLREQGEKRGVLVVSHNRQDAFELGGQTALLAGGSIQGCAPTAAFFGKPAPGVVADFVRTGSCALPSPGARPEEVDESMRPFLPTLPEAASNYVRESLGPRGFLWLKKGLLAGTPRPGIVQDIEYDLDALKRVGVTTLVSLTTRPVDPEALESRGIQGLWMPVKDMHAPGVEEAEQMCRKVSGLLSQGHVVAYHCRAGLGRTGTMLASHLIMEGRSALDALESVRRIEPRWVQSDEQVRFLERFSESLSSRREMNGHLATVN
ncbi:ATP-binding cassette domain-containing protein [Betaproteobacteria bacterium SCN2]|jgi:atypical dual specificity phosphatase|nr:ATP-binding cassette domain-containing protein [Betaproteobacteria bacterium SCN2]